MARRLRTNVHVVQRDEHGNTQQSGTFGPTDDLPDWAAEAITNPDVWADEADPEPAVEAAPDSPKPDRRRPAGK